MDTTNWSKGMSLYRTKVTDLGEIAISADIEVASSGIWFVVCIRPLTGAARFWVSVIDYTYTDALLAVTNEYGQDTAIFVWAVAGCADDWQKAKASEANPFANESLSGLDLEGFMENP